MQRIIIPTLGRFNKQETLQAFPEEYWKNITLVVRSEEFEDTIEANPGVCVAAQPDEITNIGEKRAWILRNCGQDNIIMFDDDLRFYIRRQDRRDRLEFMTKEEVVIHCEDILSRLGPELPGISMSERNNNHGRIDGWEYCTRMMYCLAFHVPTVLENVELGRVLFREDYDIAIQLLAKGLPNVSYSNIAIGQTTGYNAPGGCSTERDVQSSDDQAFKLQELHPAYVRAGYKDFKGMPRVEVRISWQACFKDGTQWRIDRGLPGLRAQEGDGGPFAGRAYDPTSNLDLIKSTTDTPRRVHSGEAA